MTVGTKQIRCPFCGIQYQVEFVIDEYLEWRAGTGSIQNVMPSADASTREALVSGICDDCFDSLGGDE